MRRAAMMARHRQDSGVIIWDSDETPSSTPLEVEEGKKNNCESQNKVCLSIPTSGSLGFSFLSQLSRQASPGVRGKTGEHQGRQETRLEPLKEVPYRGETSNQSGLVQWCARLCVFGCTLGISKTWIQCRVWAGKKKKYTATRLIKRGLVLFSHFCGGTNCWRICIYSLQLSLVGPCATTPLLLIGFLCIVSCFLPKLQKKIYISPQFVGHDQSETCVRKIIEPLCSLANDDVFPMGSYIFQARRHFLKAISKTVSGWKKGSFRKAKMSKHILQHGSC